MLRLVSAARYGGCSFLQNMGSCRRRIIMMSSALPVHDVAEPLKSGAASEIQRLKHLRNVGILAHVDAGKTTVTERMLALAGVVRNAGCVDDGNTVTDFLPAERERGITIQSAAISFDWGWHNNRTGDDLNQNDKVRIQLIDTPGHVDFSVEVNRSVAVLDGAVLIIDAVAGVQAQTETVWRAVTRPSWNNHDAFIDNSDGGEVPEGQDHAHEPLPCLALVNKMDKEGCHFGKAVASLRNKLPGANPIPIQIPLFRVAGTKEACNVVANGRLPENIVAVSSDEVGSVAGEFMGVVDLIHMRAVVWPERDGESSSPTVINLWQPHTHTPFFPDCEVTRDALNARLELIEALAEVDDRIIEYYLNDLQPSNAELKNALRRATLSRKALPVMAGAALKGKGVEPLLDSIADLLPSPMDRIPPALNRLGGGSEPTKKKVDLGHPLHPSLVALAFKVVHMKGRGGSGDGRVVFARVYSGKLHDKETIQVITPPAPGEPPNAPRTPRLERIGGMLELNGGRFDNVEGGTCYSGEVCALVGLKNVVTGDTIVQQFEMRGGKKKGNVRQEIWLAGVGTPKPVITVRLEAESAAQQKLLSESLQLMAIEDPSLVVEETDSATLLSGLGELHIEVTLDRLSRDHGLQVMVGPPLVAYRETVKESLISPGGLLDYDRTLGGTRLQAAVHLEIRPRDKNSGCILLSDPIVSLGRKCRDYLGLSQDLTEEELIQKSDLARALIQGCHGAMKRGPLKSMPLTNVDCRVIDVDAEGGLKALKALPGSLQAASANAVQTTLSEYQDSCVVLEPTMSLEVALPNSMVGAVLSDLNSRRGVVGDVVAGEGVRTKSLVRGDVPLVEVLGYATNLRSLTAGEGAFTAEYKGHSPVQSL